MVLKYQNPKTLFPLKSSLLHLFHTTGCSHALMQLVTTEVPELQEPAYAVCSYISISDWLVAHIFYGSGDTYDHQTVLW